MSNFFVRKLAVRTHLDDSDVAALNCATGKGSSVAAGLDLVSEGKSPGSAYVVLAGFACRYKRLPNGQRSILAYLVPGDGCDLHASLLDRTIHSVATLTPCVVASIPYRTIKELAAARPNIYRALWWSILADEAIVQEWLIGLGRRPADKQVAHIICELLARLNAVGLGTGPGFRLPLTQSVLADTVGLSDVHLYRVLGDLREAGLIASARKSISVPDIVRLREFAGFDPDYLLLPGAKPEAEPLGGLPEMTRRVHR